MDIIYEAICKAESTLPPNVSISKTIYSALSFCALWASLRTNAARAGSISPFIGMILTGALAASTFCAAAGKAGKKRKKQARPAYMVLDISFMLG
jgi:hypothetical protein